MAVNNLKDIPIDIVSDDEWNSKWGTKEDGSWRGYAAGTPTEQRRANQARELAEFLALQEDTRSNKVAESLKERELAEMIRANQADESYRWASLAKSGSGGSGYKPTAGERKQTATALLLSAAEDRYRRNKAEGRKYPLYYTLNSIMNDPDWAKDAIETGADMQYVIANLVSKYAKDGQGKGMGLDDYFATPTGSKLKSSYEALYNYKLNNKTAEADPLLELLNQYSK